MRVLAIGNSFSQDATHYLHQLAAAEGQDLKVGNLYIGGCSLGRHLENMQAGAAEYLYEENGASTGRYVSVDEALGMEKWDIIVTQQASHYSGILETYEPYLTLILEELFPKDQAIFLMCGGGGYAGMMKELLIYLGWDPELLYNVGANWTYTGDHAQELVIYPEDADGEKIYATWRADYAYLDFDRLHPLEDGT